MRMENLVLDHQSKNKISDYIENTHLMKYEAGIMDKLLLAVEMSDGAQLNYLNSFGDSFRAITMNLHAYRKGLEFGFTAIAFSQYGWLERPIWLDTEEHSFGDTSRYGNYSTITLGRGPNHIWTYALNYSFGCAGGGWALSIYSSFLR